MDITEEIQAKIDSEVKLAVEEANKSSDTKSAEALKLVSDEKEKILSNRDTIVQEKKLLQDKLKSYDGLDVGQLSKIKKMIDESEESDLLRQGKLDEVVDRRTEKLTIGYDQQITDLKNEISVVTDREKVVNNNFNNYKIELALNQAASASKALSTAIPDIVNRAKGLFSLDSDGQIFIRDGEGNIRKDKSGKALDAKQFVTNLEKEAPHFWPASVSANLKGAEPSEVEDQLSAAIARGDMAAYRKLRSSMG